MSTGILSSQYGVVCAVTETTYNTDAVDAAITADADLPYLAVNSGVAIDPVAADFQPDRMRPGQGAVPSSRIGQMTDVSLTIPLTAGVGANHIPSAEALLKAAGLHGSNGAYLLSTDNNHSCTVWLWERNLVSDSGTKWRLNRATGVFFNGSLSATVSEEPTLALTGPGASYHKRGEALAWFDSAGEPIRNLAGVHAYAGTAAADAAERLLCKSATLTVDGTAIPFSSITLDFALATGMINTQQSTPTGKRATRARNGVSPAGGTISAEMSDLGAAYDAMDADLEAAKVCSMVLVFQGATRKLTIEAEVQLVGQQRKRDTAGAAGWDIDFIVVDDYATHPFGDNGLAWTYAAI